jgi:hypothetical protein
MPWKECHVVDERLRFYCPKVATAIASSTRSTGLQKRALARLPRRFRSGVEW